MKKWGIAALMIVATALVSASIASAAEKITLMVNGKVVDAEVKIINGVSYVPLKAAAQALGAKAGYDAKTKTVSITSEGTAATAAPAGTNTITIKDVSITLNKVVQDSDSLRIMITYTNNSKDEVMTGDSLTKVVFDGKQYGYNTSFNFERYYEQPVDNAPSFIEPGVTAKSVIFFEPIKGADKVNIVLNANFEQYRFNNVTVSKE